MEGAHGAETVPKWEEVRSKLPGPFEVDGLYMGTGNASDSYTETSNMRDHPMVLGTLGMLPEWEKLDNETMRNTLRLIMERWDWPSNLGVGLSHGGNVRHPFAGTRNCH
jgi:protein-glucosylgalactosylhydroxylysine glucosidase